MKRKNNGVKVERLLSFHPLMLFLTIFAVRNA